ncbi:ribonuclease E [Sphingomonas sp. SORGH_AS802]|uniref:Rne/Rng family ribonuclease n=1 Tax=unclassified Sphingomonas TaxID=196159 RepID=UPI0028622FF4|nr:MULTISPECIES: ribonuclease E/G [unclassified Sphingomonas]MDR6125449.1 ribonuclease E [Sphingomonas sp. SORGH_AS_0438]MDR6134065.1 ribonuclease E [Sphingomonas sp. SORGH_AS_0802]
MTTRMLIDARHREETRVAVVQGNRIEEFDFESAERKQLKGNIYLAKVTRVEPSLQAAFVDYGGNRHGFLAFSEIHPDYYQIPKEDRDALLREEAEHAAEEAALRAEQDAHDDDDHDEDEEFDDESGYDDDSSESEDEEGGESAERPRRRPAKGGANDDQVEALRQRRMNLRRRYKIQDVIRRRQVLLVQVVKEERGNKGAALTTYLSLAGRYCVLMPNTSHGGGISRKISNAADRKRLKSIMADLQLPSSMGCIVRTAGLQRTKVEIKRDFDYLARLWDEIRDKTLTSSAPALVYGDSDLIKRAIRDIYNKDIDEVIVEGEEGYRHAKDFMRLLMPAHARKVKQYADAVPLFQRAHVEDQLAAMYNPVVQLKSGGYLVINPTEALVSIDINSGRSTREHNIEQTATATNLEAAQEIARQLRLRDMAGLVVIDFIDMDHSSNVRKVEKAMKEALKNDRARIQVGRISSFGLMEMSRQRLRTGVLEASTRACPHCEGTGLVRTASSAGLSALRLLEEEAARGRGSLLTLRASQEAAIYVLNRKRADIAEVEERYGVSIEVLPDREEEGARMTVDVSGPPPAYAPRIDELVVEEDEEEFIEEEEIEEEEELEEAEPAPRPARNDSEGEGRGKRRRRRRGRRGNRGDEGEDSNETGAESEEETDENGVEPESVEDETDSDAETTEADEPQAQGDAEGEGGRRRRRGRRGRRGGRRQDGVETQGSTDQAVEVEEAADAGDSGPVTDPIALAIVEPEVEADVPAAPVEEAAPAPKTRRRPRARAAVAETAAPAPAEVAVAPQPTPAPAPAPAPAVEAEAEAPAKPKRVRKKKVETEAPAPVVEPVAEEVPAKPKRVRKKKVEAEAPAPAPEPEAVAEEPVAEAPEAEAAPASGDAPRRGWWQRTFGA